VLLAAITPSDDLYCYHFDGVGNTVAITDSSESVVNSYDYSPFGMVISESEGFTQPFKYVGKLGVMSESNGFYYMRARYYDPVVGRFISEDPMGFDGGDVNLYVYGSNNPVLLVDPSGEFLTILGGAVGGGLAGGLTGGIVGFFSSLPTANSLRDVVVGAGQPELALSAGRLAGASLFRQGFMAATTVGEHAALTSTLGALAGGVASVATSPTPTYDGNNSSSNIHLNIQNSDWK